MPRQSFTPQAIRRSARNLWRRHRAVEIQRESERAAHDIQTGEFQFGNISQVRENERTAYVFQDLYSRLISNRISENIKSAYKIKPANRDLIIHQVATLLREGAPFTIYKFDIHSFFESANRENILKNLERDLYLSAETRNKLHELFSHPILRTTSGLPLGISVSAPLSEYLVTSLDHGIRRQPTVYYYTRFVDDILIFSLGDDDSIPSTVASFASAVGLEVNWRKHTKTTIRCSLAIDDTGAPPGTKCYPVCKCRENDGQTVQLDYLGYRFRLKNTPSGGKRRKDIDITISPKKVKKIKSRLARSVVEYSYSGDYSLLRDRLRLLTGCYSVVSKPGHSSLLSGNAFNYRKLTTLESLKELDRYKRKLLFSRRGPLGKRLDSLMSKDMRRRLARISFVTSYDNFVIWNFNRNRIYQIKRCFPE